MPCQCRDELCLQLRGRGGTPRKSDKAISWVRSAGKRSSRSACLYRGTGVQALASMLTYSFDVHVCIALMIDRVNS